MGFKRFLSSIFLMGSSTLLLGFAGIKLEDKSQDFGSFNPIYFLGYANF
jgi:hypothetical protein